MDVCSDHGPFFFINATQTLGHDGVKSQLVQLKPTDSQIWANESEMMEWMFDSSETGRLSFDSKLSWSKAFEMNSRAARSVHIAQLRCPLS